MNLEGLRVALDKAEQPFSLLDQLSASFVRERRERFDDECCCLLCALDFPRATYRTSILSNFVGKATLRRIPLED